MTNGGQPRSPAAHAVDARITTGADGRVTGADDAARAAFGLGEDGGRGRTLPELLAPPGDAPPAWSHLDDLLSGDAPAEPWHRVRLDAIDAAGDRVPVEVSLAPAADAAEGFHVRLRSPNRVAGEPPEAERCRTLLDATEQVARIGTWEWTPATTGWWWSDNTFRLLGHEPGAIEPSVGYLQAHCHPDDRARLGERLSVRGWPEALEPMDDFRMLMPDGRVRHMRVSFAVVEEHDRLPRRLLGTIQDVTARRRAEREIAAHVAVAEALGGWTGLREGGERLLAGLGEAMGSVAGVLWVPEGDVLAPRVVWSSVAGDPRDAEVARLARLRRGVGLPGQAWLRREPANVVDLLTGGDVWGDPRVDAASRMGLRGGVAVPALCDREVLAVIELASREESEMGERLMRSLTGIGYEIGQFLSRRRGELEAPVLTAREIEVLALAAEGLPARRTAERLVVSHATIRTHFDNIYAKLGVSDKASAVATAMRLGLID